MNADSTLPQPRPAAAPSGELPGLAVLLRRLPYVALAGGLGLACGLGFDQARTPVYESTAYLTVTSDVNQDAGSLARTAQALARIATSPGVVSEPLREAGLTTAASAPRLYIRVQAAPDAPIISITGTATDAEAARLTTLTVSQALTDLDTLDPFDVEPIGTTRTPTEPTTPQWVAPAGGAGLGAGLALVLAATMPSRRRDLRLRDDQRERQAVDLAL